LYKEVPQVAEAKQLFSMADVDAVLAESAQRPVLVFKHSTTCPISARGHREWEQFLASPEADQVGHAWVRVIEERPVSLGLAEKVGVKHESPQALLVKNGQVVWHDSHFGLTVAAFKDAVK
jgi:bacillithiol system protein YtxJ